MGERGRGDEPGRRSRPARRGARRAAPDRGGGRVRQRVGDQLRRQLTDPHRPAHPDRRAGANRRRLAVRGHRGFRVGVGGELRGRHRDRIDPTTARPTTISVRPGPTGIVAAFGSVWVTNSLDASVTEIDPDTNEPVNVVPVGAGPTGIAAGAGYLWVTNRHGTVTRFHPDTLVPDPPVPVGTGPNRDRRRRRRRLGHQQRARVTVPDRRRDPDRHRPRTGRRRRRLRGRRRGGDVWVSNEYAGTLMRVTASTFRLADTIEVRGAPLALAYVGDDTSGSPTPPAATPCTAAASSPWSGPPQAGMAGRAARLRPHPPVGTTSPGQRSGRADQTTAWSLPAGGRGAGDAASTLPVPPSPPTAGSPPRSTCARGCATRPVTRCWPVTSVAASSGRSCIPTLSPSTTRRRSWVPGPASRPRGRPWPPRAPRRGCDLSDGITTDDRTGTVTFHLTGPTPNSSVGAAVRVRGSARHTAGPGTGGGAAGHRAVHDPLLQRAGARVRRAARTTRPAGAGAQPALPGVVARRRSGPATPTASSWRPARDKKQAVARVIDGRADVLWFDEPPTDGDMLRTRYGPQLHTSAGKATRFAFLNASKPPFDNRDARRALAQSPGPRSAHQRGEHPLRAADLPTPHQLTAYQPYCPFTAGGGEDGKWVAPDVATATDLVRASGTRGARVVLVVPEPGHPGPRSGRADGGPAGGGRARPDRLPRLAATSLRVVPRRRRCHRLLGCH